MLGATILCVLLLLMVKCEESPGVEPQNPRNLEPIPSLFSLNTCQYLRNVSDVETLNRHQFEILEQCLYYYLAAEAQRKAQYFNAIQALSAFPPEAANARGSRVKLFFHQITLQHFVMVSKSESIKKKKKIK
ncbi:unnamed protein product [Brugia timori]|uniref:Secreted protein n=1 Tax=Brugia timori TaxID=42155 RepID=A0A0R3RAE3_9BILA|nr:unnamed protein product [Brugia timori]